MPIRILTYLGLLYQDLIQQGKIARGDKLPPVLPIVLCNGKPRWQAATQIADLIEPAPGTLGEYTPQLKYLLLDEGTLDERGPLGAQQSARGLVSTGKEPSTREY